MIEMKSPNGKGLVSVLPFKAKEMMSKGWTLKNPPKPKKEDLKNG